ncbi:MAG: biotin--[acetyl-CoA-carboxylase] ligase [Flavobacteriales bacterium]|nr:biotin--[acetyl-CoA-carboxylase] ligase [Bacteroidota bacterium]MCB9240497.1 biotin--[acetyl-CoA-carboxylase] ligase [Flavobacteriales bacterium]
MEIPSPQTRFIGHHVMQYDKVMSTNDMLMEKIREGNLQEGAIVLAGEQMRGRGQHGKAWESPAGRNVLMSIYLKPSFLNGTNFPMLASCIALGVRAVLQRHLPERELRVKWPNDILCNGKKICGILIENHLNGVQSTTIVGIGINVFQSIFHAFERQATSILLEQPGFVGSVSSICSDVCEWVERYYLTLRQPNGPQQIRDLYVSQLYRLNEQVLVDATSWMITGVSLSGKLLLQNGDHRLELEHNEKKITWN